MPHVVVLGAGPAGLGAAFQLARSGKAAATVLERQNAVGGNAGSFDIAGLRVDYGSHRLHPTCGPAVLEDIRALLADDLLDRPRHGRIRLCGEWIHFPLKPLDLVRRLPLSFPLGVARDSATRLLSGPASTDAGLGETICTQFYFPYARKVWGVSPEALSAEQARRRVSAGSIGRMARKILSSMPGLKKPGAGRFFYPRHGYGEICERYAAAASSAGAELRLNAKVESVNVENGHVCVHYESNGRHLSMKADRVWSTIPMTALARCMRPAPPPECLEAIARMSYRAMVLVYLVLEQDRFSEYDAHYFPEEDIRMSRLSEPKNYSQSGPHGRTVLCAELPCDVRDPEWTLSDELLGRMVCRWMESAGIPVTARVREVVTRRLPQAYPIYRQGYERHFDRLDSWLGQFEQILTFGRQGLFAHDNAHHALHMAYSAADCLGADGSFDASQWSQRRQSFMSHVVED
jgi:protoporphyrinogen oxidase